jgi:glycosyltransferase involved in cell wall biosynthesis
MALLERGHSSDAGAPLVSVIIPAYNAAPYITETIDSVFAQTYSNYEVIIVNDGSPDTDALEGALAPYRHSAVYIKQANRGPGGARNAGILRARGEYVAFLDSDDTWLPYYLAQQMRVLEQDSTLDLVYSDALLFGDPASSGRTFMQNNPSRGPVTFESLLRWECHVITSCVVARRQTLINAGLFDDRYHHAEDFDLWLRVAHRGGRITYQEQVLARYRKRPGTLSTAMTRMNRTRTEILRNAARTLDLLPAQRELLSRQIAEAEAFADLEYGKERLLDGQFDEARAALRRASGYYRTWALKVTVLCLRVAPRALRRAYEFRDQYLRR